MSVVRFAPATPGTSAALADQPGREAPESKGPERMWDSTLKGKVVRVVLAVLATILVAGVGCCDRAKQSAAERSRRGSLAARSHGWQQETGRRDRSELAAGSDA